MDFTRIRNLAQAATYEEMIDILFVGRLVEQKDPLRFLELTLKTEACWLAKSQSSYAGNRRIAA